MVNDAFYIAIQAGHCPKAVAAPGMAKTESLRCFSVAVERSFYILLGSIRDPSDFGMPFLINHDIVHATKEGGAYFVLAAPKWAHDMQKGKWLLLLDELTSCPPAVQSGMLRVVAERVVGDLALPADTWMASLCNPPDLAANGFELEPPMANRLVHLQWEMDWEAWDAGMSSGGNFPAPKFPIAPPNWRDYCPQVGTMFAAFRKFKPDAFSIPVDIHGNITGDRSTLHGAYPSPRSWKIAMDCRACGLAAGVEPIVLLQLLEGCVGHVATEYDTWERNLDLPDPEEMIRKAMQAIAAGQPVPYKHPNRPDKVIAMLGSVAAAVVGNRHDPARYNAPRWEAALAIIVEAGRKEKDVAISMAMPLFKFPDGAAARPPEAKLSNEFMAELAPTITSVMFG